MRPVGLKMGADEKRGFHRSCPSTMGHKGNNDSVSVVICTVGICEAPHTDDIVVIVQWHEQLISN